MLRKLPTWLHADGEREERKQDTMGSQTDPGANLALLLTSCVTLDESLSLPEPASCPADTPYLTSQA